MKAPSRRKPKPSNGSTSRGTGDLKPLMSAKISDLRSRYLKVFRKPPPSAFGPELLRMAIAHQLQVKLAGGPDAKLQKRIDQLVRKFRDKPIGRQLEIPRRIKPGSEIVRTWTGKTYRVVVLAEGFQHAGQIYSSLSEVASDITGTNWNGPRFFGLRSKMNGAATNG